MTFTIKLRLSPGSRMTAEYECPVHGRFSRSVQRRFDGDPPIDVHCEQTVDVDAAAVWDGGVPGNRMPFPCDELCPLVISAPAVHMSIGYVAHTGRSDPHHPNQLDTRPIADGMPVSEWRALQDKKDREARWKQNRKVT